jgi:hypothetical protein
MDLLGPGRLHFGSVNPVSQPYILYDFIILQNPNWRPLLSLNMDNHNNLLNYILEDTENEEHIPSGKLT